MAMTLCPQTAPNVLNLSYRRGWDPGSLPPSVLIMFCTKEVAVQMDGWAHLEGAMGWGSCHTGSQMCRGERTSPAGMHHRTSPLGEGTESRTRLRDDG